jgi:hypothetical protein
VSEGIVFGDGFLLGEKAAIFQIIELFGDL